MSESLLSFTIIFAELGGVLLLVGIGWVMYFFYCIRKEGKNTRELIVQVKEALPAHREQLVSYFKTELELEDKKADLNVHTLMNREKKLYDHLINVSISRDMTLLRLTADDLNSLINDYVRLLKLTIEKETDDSKISRELALKKENEALRIENASLKNRLENATETIENMMGEFSSMYEGGKKEGEQRVKNEMYKLQQAFKSEEVKVKNETKGIDEKIAAENEGKE
jgi:FtsZ-binding cell division protein ZapB